MSGLFTLAGFAAHLAKLAIAVEHETHHALERAARVVQKEARAEIGTYQGAAGPFVAWAPLAQSTLDGWHGHPGKIALGYAPPDNPLLRTGDMRDSIEFTVGRFEAHVGSDDDKAVWQELGTSRIPPRSFLGGAAFRKKDQVAHEIGHDLVAVLIGGSVARRIP